jgi:phage baseplate assembly protein W|tara:strand:- start:803 stop:1243 length:441 start_codon:yes stop_codon:yes gene_type:complete
MSVNEKQLYKSIAVGSSSNESPVQSKKYRGISTVDKNTRNFVKYDLQLIKQDIVNHFHIRQGEKLENPEFGTIIWDVLFEPLTDSLKEAIIKNVTDIINYDPRVSVNNVTIDSFESGIQIECNLTYLPYNISESMRLTFDESAGLI